MREKIKKIESNITNWCKAKGPKFLVFAFALIFIWFGALKVYGISPAEQLVKDSTQWIFSHQFVIFLGFWEIAIGALVLFRSLRFLGIMMLFMQLPGTFMPLFTNPEDCFTLFPFGLTLEGQYIFKNIILASSALIILGTLASPKSNKS